MKKQQQTNPPPHSFLLHPTLPCPLRHPNVIYDSAGKLHVMIHHVDQVFVQQCMIQKYCSETQNRQQCRSITLQLHNVHPGILPVATAFSLAKSQIENQLAILWNNATEMCILILHS